MAEQIKLYEVSTLREAVATAFIHSDAYDSARSLLNMMRREAAEHGFTDADVIRAVLRPIFHRVRGCDHYTCKARHGDALQDQGALTRQVHANAR